MLAFISMSFVPPSCPKLGAQFSLVTVYLASLLFSLLLFKSRVVCLPPCSLLLQKIKFFPQPWWSLLGFKTGHALRLSPQSRTSVRRSSLNILLRQRFFAQIMLSSLSKPLYIRYVMIMELSTKPLVLIPHSKLSKSSEFHHATCSNPCLSINIWF